MLGNKSFYEIERYNGTKVLVENLNLWHRQIWEYNCKCLKQGKQTTTSAFCANYLCKSDRIQFCFCVNNEVVFVVDVKNKVSIKT